MALADALLNLYDQNMNPSHVAIAFPGILSEVTSSRLLLSLRSDLESRIAQGTSRELETVLSWLPIPGQLPDAKRCGQYYKTTDKILFSSVENLAGLERAIVVVCGFHLPEYLLNRSDLNSSRVDSRAFLAVSRCTYKVVFVEVKAESCFANHIQISQRQRLVNGKHVAKYSYSGAFHPKLIIDDVIKSLYLPLHVDCKQLSESTFFDLENRTTVVFMNYSGSVASKVQKYFSRCGTPSLRKLVFVFDSKIRDKKNIRVAFELIKSCTVCASISVLAFEVNKSECSLEGLDLPTTLKKIQMSDMKLTGAIPGSISSLVNLQLLNLSDNQLSGAIPESISSLVKLKTLALFDNLLSGAIPESISSLINLQHLHLNGNQLSGAIPESISSLINLEILHLSSNQLSGVIPESISSLISLQYLHLSFNNLSGAIPKSISGVINLHHLYLSGNLLSGAIPESISSLINLQTLDLSDNELSGAIPESISRLSHIRQISVKPGNDGLECIPSCLFHLPWKNGK